MSLQFASKRKKTLKKPKAKTQWSAYGYLAPAIVTISLLSIAPIIYTIYIAFTNFNANHFLDYQFVGFDNFIKLFTPGSPLASVFLPTLLWTFLYAILATFINYGAGLFLAVVLNNKGMKESAIYRTLLIIPWAVPGLISMLIWKGLLNTSFGQINGLLHSLFGMDPIPWLDSPMWAHVSILLVSLWAGFPYMMSVCLGALQSVPTEQYEAASIDGATWFQKFRSITMASVWKISLPLLIPTFAFNFNNFNAVYLLTGGDPARTDNQFAGSTDILASAAYKMTLQFNRYDWAAAISIFLFALVAILSLINMKFTRAFEEVD
ncbi:arabinogalactan oligomer/maltooligosaccharide transport system permease protein [Pullulanibacillus pueri]|uniref:Maltose/maltodextrin transport system permease protein n=1 Tax=Pullulanibacillus pueri TaxID=1437324 RepID=A0A8J2ZVG1_9BACL|nr:sugar ABC transporter permease [Pullulanibacillus pueri]MBM7682072.1 arabinogalactan oligomer/maltooligosaccharide transport system permease protein [Pullulanibacillus pueri]GGH80089.1 hypothetical protein GCM10007096_15980 [Pullulanibacillus pueri]